MPVVAQARPKAKLDKAELRRRRAAVRKVEAEISDVHAEKDRLAELIATSGGTSTSSGSDVVKAYEKTVRKITQLESDWEKLTEGLEGPGS